MSDYAEREKFWCEMKGIKEGSKVTITTTAQTDEDGWNNDWSSVMNDCVGKVGIVVNLSNSSRVNRGIRVNLEGIIAMFSYPYWVVEPVKE